VLHAVRGEAAQAIQAVRWAMAGRVGHLVGEGEGAGIEGGVDKPWGSAFAGWLQCSAEGNVAVGAAVFFLQACPSAMCIAATSRSTLRSLPRRSQLHMRWQRPRPAPPLPAAAARLPAPARFPPQLAPWPPPCWRHPGCCLGTWLARARRRRPNGCRLQRSRLRQCW
jgi:hypothetical protein